MDWKLSAKQDQDQAPVVTDVEPFGEISLLREALFRKMDQIEVFIFYFSSQ